MLRQANLRPQKMFGQNFLIDQNLLAAVVALRGAAEGDFVVEVGPGTGTLTEALLDVGAEVLAVEIDRGLADLLGDRLGGRDRFTLIEGDALAGKHALNEQVVEAVTTRERPALLVANLPYNIATPLIAEVLRLSLRQGRAGRGGRFASMTVTVQKEVAQRLTAPVNDEHYGPISVLTALLGRAGEGRDLPASAFWPRPRVTSRMLRIDCVDPGPVVLPAIEPLDELLRLTFGQRRKQIHSAAGRAESPFSAAALAEAIAAAGVEPTARPQEVPPAAWAAMAARLNDRPV